MSKYIKIRCPKCRDQGRDTTGNNFAIRLDSTPPNAHCHGCGYHVKNYDISNIDLTKHKAFKSKPVIPKGTYSELKTRGISQKVCEMYNYSVTKDYTGRWLQLVNWKDKKTGRIIAQKARTMDKKFFWLGEKERVTELFGQQLFNPNERIGIVVTEGEIDAMSYAQGTGAKWPCVSVKDGASSALKQLESQAEWLNGFKKIVICFDADEAGDAAAQAIAESPKFKHGKVHISNLPEGHDINSLLLAGRFKEVDNAILRASQKRLEDIVRPSDYTYEELMASDPFGAPIAYPILNDLIRGIKASSLYLLCAGTGLGKSTFAKELAYDLAINQGLNIGNMFIEQGDIKCMRDFVAIDNNVRAVDFHDDPTILPESKIKASFERIDERMCFYKHFGSLDQNILIDKIEYMFNNLDCDIVILDHISIVVSGAAGSGNERKDIDVLMTNLRTLIERTGKTVIAISHLKRTDKGNFNEGTSVGTNDLRGSGTLEQIPDYIIALERDQWCETPDIARLKLLKSRETGEVCYADYCKYSKETGRFLAINECDLDINEEGKDDAELDCF